MTPILLWGATGQARVLAEFLPAIGYEIVALVDLDPHISSFLDGVPIFHSNRDLAAWRASHPGEVAALPAIGGANGRERLSVQSMLADAGYLIPTVIHPRAFVAADALLGAGTQILALASVCAAARLGEGCIVNTGASVDHECRLDDGVHVGPHAALAGAVHLGVGAFIGTNATVVPRTRIGADAIVGAGAVVVDDVPERAVVYGNPARVGRVRDLLP